MLKMVHVLHVLKVMIFSMAFALFQHLTTLNPQIQAALFGNGISKNVKFAQKIGFSIQITFVFLLMINAKHIVILELVLLVSKDMI
jgi:hypothetical protein